MTIIASRSNVNPEYETHLMQAVYAEKNRHVPKFTRAGGAFDDPSLDDRTFRKGLRIWVAVYCTASGFATNPLGRLPKEEAEFVSGRLLRMGYLFNPTWQKAHNPLTSILIRESDLIWG